MVFLTAALSLAVIIWSVILFSSSIFSFGLPWSWGFPFNTKPIIIVITLAKKGGVWSSFYWPAIFKMIWTNFGVFAHFKCFLFPDESTKTLFTSFVRVFTLSSFLERKNAFALIHTILKYVVLRHNNLNIDGHYHMIKLRICHFSHIKKTANIYEVKNTRITTLLTLSCIIL